MNTCTTPKPPTKTGSLLQPSSRNIKAALRFNHHRVLLVHGQRFRDRFPPAGPGDFNRDRRLVPAESKVKAGIVLVAFTGAGLDVAGEGAVAEAQAGDGADEDQEQ